MSCLCFSGWSFWELAGPIEAGYIVFLRALSGLLLGQLGCLYPGELSH